MKAVKLATDNGNTVWISVVEDLEPVTPAGTGGEIAGDGVRKALERMDDLADTIADVYKSIQQKIMSRLGETKPDEITIEFGVVLAGEAAVPLICSSSVEGAFKVSACWDLTQDDKKEGKDV